MVQFLKNFEDAIANSPPFHGSKGSIVRLKIQDFMTYHDVELRAGPNINLVVGPNGTGKSTIVCAICMALAGKPKILGRATGWKEYIRSGATSATVEVELFNPGGNINWQIKRTIHELGGTNNEWFLNGARCGQKDIEKLMESLNIQLDNLCQFLPQDRVQDFAKMDKIQLLKSTEMSMGSCDGNRLEMQHEELINLQAKIRQIQHNLKTHDEKLRREIQQNSWLDHRVRVYKEREAIKEQISHLEGKRLWIHFVTAMRDLTELQSCLEKTNAKKLSEEKKLAPFQKKIQEISSALAHHREEMNKLKTGSLAAFKDLKREFRDKTEAAETDIQRYKAELNSSEELEKSRLRRLEDHKEKLFAYEQEQDELLKRESVDESALMAQFQQLDAQLNELNEKIFEIQKLNDMDEGVIRMAKARLRTVEKDLSAMKEIRNSRMTYLHVRYPAVAKLVEYLADKDNLAAAGFHGQVHEPLILNIGVTDLEYGKIAERCIPKSDLTAFYVENKDDVRKVLDLAFEKKFGKVSAICHEMPEGYQPPPAFRFSDDWMRWFGFEKNLIDLIQAPMYYMSYLCGTVRPQDILIGSERTNSMAEEIAEKTDLRSFFTSSKAFFVKKSFYRPDKTINMHALFEAQIFTDKINASEKDRLEEVRNRIELDIQEVENTMENRRPRLNDLSTERDNLERAKVEIKDRIEYRRKLEVKVAQYRRMIEKDEGEKQDLELRRIQCQQETLKARERQERVLARYVDGVSKIAENWWDFVVRERQVSLLQDCVVTMQNEIQETRARINTYSNDIKGVEARKKVAADTANKYKMDAQAKTGEKGPPHDVDYGLLDEEQVLSEINRLDVRLNILPESDGKSIEEYQTRKKKIEDMESIKFETEAELKELQQQLSHGKDAWLEPLKLLIHKINFNFGKFFEKISCVGEISLDEGEDEEDFAKYGVKIMVKFRTSEPLTELCGWKQSGGERAITTALYILALQELTKVPFRVIDEINQGMDETNERRFFKLLCSLAQGSDTPQYFLLTPKMLPPVDYPDNVKFHIIFNGPYIHVEPDDAIEWTEYQTGDSDEEIEDDEDESSSDEGEN